MTTINKVAMGPSNSDSRNQFRRERFFCSASPALIRDRANHPPPPALHADESSMIEILAVGKTRGVVRTHVLGSRSQHDLDRRGEKNARRSILHPVAVSTGQLSKMWLISHR